LVRKGDEAMKVGPSKLAQGEKKKKKGKEGFLFREGIGKEKEKRKKASKEERPFLVLGGKGPGET